MKPGYKKSAPQSKKLIDTDKVGGLTPYLESKVQRLAELDAPMVVRCAECPDWKFEGSTAECRGAQSEHRSRHERDGMLSSAFDLASEMLRAARRRERVAELRFGSSPLSIRAIARELGVSKATVERDLQRLSPPTGRPGLAEEHRASA